MSKLCPRFGGDGTKIAPPGDIFDQPPGDMSSIWGKLADHVGNHAALSPEGGVVATSPETELSYPCPPPDRRTTPLIAGKNDFIPPMLITSSSNLKG